MRIKLVLALLFFAMVLALLSCSPHITRVMNRFLLDKPFPDRDIVFIAEWLTLGHYGFVQSDGSGAAYVRLSPVSGEGLNLTPLTWSSDGKSVFMTTDYYNIPTMLRTDGSNGIRYALIRELDRVDRHFSYVSVLPAAQQAYFTDVDRIVVLELDKDPVVLISYSKLVYLEIGANPLCGRDRIVFLYIDERKIPTLIFLNKENGTQTSLSGETGTLFRRPSCSPDGRWVAYTTEDGIYLIRPDGTEKRLLEPIDFDAMINSDTLPAASWSPDGKWIVYHHCKSGTSCNMEDESAVAVYKMNIETGQKIKLVDGGLFPYWRWRVEDLVEPK